jgi:hypothetical protein
MPETIVKKSKESNPLPEGAKVVSTSVRVEVEEIENGFLITKNIETKYKKKGAEYHDWHNETRKYYSEDDPLSIDTEDKALADLFKG